MNKILIAMLVFVISLSTYAKDEKDYIVLTDDNFKKEVLESDIPVIVDFWAEWCGPCKVLGPTIEKMATEYKGKIKVGKVNVDNYKKLAIMYKVRSIPYVATFKEGKVVDSFVGSIPEKDVKAFFEKQLEK